MTHLRPSILAGASLLLLVIIGNVISLAWRAFSPAISGDPLSKLPRVFFWVWERPENLEFLNPHKAGVAVLTKSLILEGPRLQVRPRLQPVRLPPGIPAIAVVRIDSDAEPIPGHSDSLQDEIVQQVKSEYRRSTTGVQIDFDATATQREFYKSLLTKLRVQLPPGLKLSITALASWCINDTWIRDLPVDEAVPMLFRLGKGRNEVVQFLRSGGDFLPKISRFSIGLSTDELLAPPRKGRRIYFFSPLPWNRQSVEEAFRRARELQ